MSGFLKPPRPGWYWLTYRTADAAPGYGWEHPDRRFRYRWSPEWEAWEDSQEPRYFMLHSNNGWRIEGPCDPPSA